LPVFEEMPPGSTPPAAHDPCLLRAPNPEERKRIEAARLALDRAAFWAKAIAFYLPGLVSAAALTGVVVSYQGTAVEIALVVLPSAAILAALMLIMFSSTGRTIPSAARMKSDAERGFTIQREPGEVSWGRRERAYVASAGGQRLISPFFTQYASAPAFWHHFEALAPGRYEFELLPASRLVLNAWPVAELEIPMHGELDALGAPANVALLAAFGIDASDIEADRQGRASIPQRWRLLCSEFWVFLLLPFLGFAFYGAIPFAHDAAISALLVAALVLLGLTVFVVVLCGRVLLDVVQGRIDSAVGNLQVSFDDGTASATIGLVTLSLSNRRARSIQSGCRYRAYWFRWSRELAALESAESRAK
jgi:hypothetical protein